MLNCDLVVIRLQTELTRAWQMVRLFWLINCYNVLRISSNWIDRKEGLLEQRCAQLMSRRILKVLDLEAEVEGAEHIKDLQHYCIVSNHASYLDWVLILAVFPQEVSFIAKKELTWFPVLGGYLRNRGVLIDRKKGLSARNQIRDAAKDSPWPIVIFPEGTRSPDGEIKKFRRAGVHMLAEEGRKLLPITLLGTHEALARNARAIRRGRKMKLVISPSVDPASVGVKEAVQITEQTIRDVYQARRENFADPHDQAEEAPPALRAV